MKFKIGDRVALYSSTRKVGAVVSMDAVWGAESYTGCMTVRCADNEEYIAYPKQCRLLKSKPLRRIWVPTNNALPPGDGFKFKTITELNYWLELKPADTRRWVEFVEVRRQKAKKCD